VSVCLSLSLTSLAEHSHRYAEKLKALEARIYQLAGREFVIASPKQLAGVLFNELRLPKPTKKSKGGDYSTDAEVLEIAGVC
jgi:DNA polymerase-1